MIRYHPLPFRAPWDRADEADLFRFDWQDNVAIFATHDEAVLVRVLFGNEPIVRLLDEFALSTEAGGAMSDGLVPHHFAYRVEGDPFLAAQSEVWREHMSPRQPMQHYRFITGNGCLDAVAAQAPTFQVVRSR